MWMGRITVTIDLRDVPEDGDCVRPSVIDRTDHSAVKLAPNIRVVIIDGHHRHAALGYLRKDRHRSSNWTRCGIPV